MIGFCECGCGQRTPVSTYTSTRWGRKKGQPLRFLNAHKTRRPINPVIHLSNGTSVLTLTRRDGQIMRCTIDTRDYPTVRAYRWTARLDERTWYAVTFLRNQRPPRVPVKMHKMILPNVAEVDHRDHNGLNNRRKNLRPSTRSQNMANTLKRTARRYTSRFKGVNWKKRSQRWAAEITVNYKHIHLGNSFKNEIDAARAYDAAAVKYFGEFAHTNFSQGKS